MRKVFSKKWIGNVAATRRNMLTKKIGLSLIRIRSIIDFHYKINYRNRGVLNFIDIGSAGGLPKPWKSNANIIRFLLNFEPNEQPRKGLNFMTYNTAVWETDTVLPFYIYKGLNAMGSSLFMQNYDYVRKNYEVLKQRGPSHLAETWFERSGLVETRLMRCRPLDEIAEELFPKMPFHFIKIDAQGAEYHILKGAQSLLRSSCIGLHVELFVLPLYKDIVMMDQVQEFLEGLGFFLAKKFPPHGTFDSQHDCLFLKKGVEPVKQSLILKVYGLQNDRLLLQ